MEPCINGKVLALAAYFGELGAGDGRLPGRLLDEQLENPHEGEVHFDMEPDPGQPSRWNTLRALRVLRWYDRAERSNR